MEAQGVYLNLFAETSLKETGIGQWCSRARTLVGGGRGWLRPVACAAKKTSATKLLPYY